MKTTLGRGPLPGFLRKLSYSMLLLLLIPKRDYRKFTVVVGADSAGSKIADDPTAHKEHFLL